MIGKNKHFIALNDFTKKDVVEILEQSRVFKKEFVSSGSHEFGIKSLINQRVGLIFLKASTRTKVSFESAVHSLGGYPVSLDVSSSQLGRGESLADTVKVLERYVQGIAIRNDSQTDLEEVASFSRVPIINALSDLAHPCQALADMLTILEKTSWEEGIYQHLKVVYLGDGNNVALSLAKICKIVGVSLTVVTPKGFECPAEEVSKIDKLDSGSHIKNTVTYVATDELEEVKAAVKGSDVIYTDTWASMGQDEEKQARKAIFSPFQVNERLVAEAKKDFLFLHCLPAYRGEEVSAGVLDGPNSVVFDQAENRMHVQKAILHLLLK